MSALTYQEQTMVINSLFGKCFSATHTSNSYRALLSYTSSTGDVVPMDFAILSATHDIDLKEKEDEQFSNFASFLRDCIQNSDPHFSKKI